MYNIAIIEDDLDIRKSLSNHFSKSSRITCVMAVDTVETFVKFHRDFLDIHLILLDVRLYNQSGIHGIPLIREREPEAEIVMYTIADDYDTIFRAICNGATGYLLKDSNHDVLEEQIVQILNGEGALVSPVVAKKILSYFNKGNKQEKQVSIEPNALSQKENAVITLLIDGHSYDDIAAHLGVSLNGVRYYIKGIYRKLEVKSKGELYRKLRRG
jgi:DNA-binding NarL/FixJ family response regulator